MAANEIHVGDTGTVFAVTLYDGTTVVDLTGYATTRELHFRKPDGTIATVTATAATPTDGTLRYTSLAGTFDQAGTWQVQAFIESAGESYSSDILTFIVYEAF